MVGARSGQRAIAAGHRTPGRTLCEVLDADVVELLYLLHDELLLVDLDDDGGVACIAACEAELAEGRLELLGDVDGAGLRGRGSANAGDNIGWTDHGRGGRGGELCGEIASLGRYRLD